MLGPDAQRQQARNGKAGLTEVIVIGTLAGSSGETDDHWVAIDVAAAGETAATLMGRSLPRQPGKLLVIADSLQSRDSLERRSGFDHVINASFPHLGTLPSLETYGYEDRAHQIIAATFRHHRDIVGVHILSSEARAPLDAIRRTTAPGSAVIIAHEHSRCTLEALADGTLGAVNTQDTGHLVRSAVSTLRALTDARTTLKSQEKIRIEILSKTNV